MRSIKQFRAGWFGMVMGVAIAAAPVHAQSIVSDTTLNTRVDFDLNGPNGPTYTINDGLTSGSNLFHSFSDFGLLNGETANFASGAGILNVISRVTGGNISTIDGILQAGEVNLFIINPSGLTFTDNAELRVGRSFIGSTAGSLLFEDGTRLETGSTATFGGTAAMPVTLEITSGSGGPVNVIDTGIDGFANDGDVGLQVDQFETLALIGGDILSEGGILQAPQGDIHLAALSTGESITLDVAPNSGELTVQRSQSEDILTSSGNLLSLSNSIVAANLFDGQNGIAGFIDLSGSSILLDNDTEVQSVVFNGGEGEPGLIGLTTSSEGTVSLSNGAKIFTTIEPGGIFSGIIGIISINTGLFTMDNGAELQALVRDGGTGEPGNILISAEQGVEISGAGTIISAELLGEGTGQALDSQGGNLLDILNNSSQTSELFGSVLIFTPGDVVLSDQASISSATVANNGNAGAVAIGANNIILSDEVFISSSTGSNGEAGTVFLEATGDITVTNSAAIATVTTGDGDGGAILLNADNLFVENGGVVSSAAFDNAAGNAGLILAFAENDLVVRGQDSSINSLVDAPNSNGNFNVGNEGGAIILSARRVGALNGGEITVSNNSSGDPGAIIIGADLVALNRGGEISAEASGTSTGGSIVIVGDSESNAFFTVLANESNISTSTEFGTGGAIAINAFPEIIAAPSQDSNILTESKGDNPDAVIALNNNLFLRNIAVTSESNSILSNDISAASGTNADGTVNGGSLENSLLQDPLLLPTDLVDPSRLIAQGCAAGDLQAARNIGDLTLTGRDGLPTTPEEQLSSSATPSTLATVDNGADLVEAEAWVAANRDRTPEPPMAAAGEINETTEAQTWRYGRDGQVVLTAKAESVSPSSLFPGFSCDVF